MSRALSLLRGPVLLAAGAGLAWLERRYPLRERVESELPRVARNLGLAASSGLLVAALERPLAAAVARAVARRRWGILPRLGLPPLAQDVLAFVALDYSLFAWHALMHRAPLLWRFHRAHHADRDLDVSTALRFHAGEFLLSVPWRAAQIALLGASPGALAAWQTGTALGVLFHHANLRLPDAVERALGYALITPRAHGLHHATRPDLAGANLGTVLSWWDALHGTRRTDVAQHEITIGPAGERPREWSFAETLAMPFVAR